MCVAVTTLVQSSSLPKSACRVVLNVPVGMLIGDSSAVQLRLRGLLLCTLLGIRMCIRCLTRTAWKVQNDEARSTGEMTPCCLHLSVHESVSEVNCSGGDVQVVSHHCCIVVFHPVEQLTVFHTSGLVLASSSIFRVLDLDLHAIAHWHPECQKVRKLCINPYISIINP